ncbi:MAG: S8 family serine peptidase [bacterium]
MKARYLIIILLIVCSVSLFSASDRLYLKINEISTKYGAPDYSSYNLQRNSIDGYDYFVVQFNDIIRPNFKNEIKKNGGEVFDYIPDNAYIVKMDAKSFAKVKEMKSVQFVQIWQPAYRIDPKLLNEDIVSVSGKDLPGKIQLKVTMFEKENKNNFYTAVSKVRGVKILQGEHVLLVEVNEAEAREKTIELASIREVYWVSRFLPFELHNAWSRWIMDTFDTLNMKAAADSWKSQLSMSTAADSARMQLYAHGLYGQNQIVGVDDTGCDWDNIYFRDPLGTKPVYDKDDDTICEAVGTHRKIVCYNAYQDTFDLSSSGHGSHTSGSVLADSMNSGLPSITAFPRVMGMAPMAKLAFYDIGGTGDVLYTPTDIGEIYIWQYNAGARITTSSWGYSAGGSSGYDTEARNVDIAGWNHKDMCMFRSSGNDNTSNDSTNTPATAKNIVTVGATESGFGAGSTTWAVNGTSDRNELLDVAEFSSHGPTYEGQRKPEVLGCGGLYIWSVDSDGNLASNNSGIMTMGGTSMSTPTTAGFAALIRQYFTAGWYPSGAPDAGDAITPSGALIKAMLVNSTRNSPGAYSTDAINNTGTQNAPSMGQGWGRVTMADVIYFEGDERDLWVVDETTGFTAVAQYNEYTINLGSSTSEYVKVVLTWTDYPANTGVTNALVNDLNLTVTLDGNTYLGNVFGTSSRSITGGSADNRNVTEVVWLNAVAGGTLTIRVTAANIPNGPQPYAVVATGDFVSITGHKPSVPSLYKLYDCARVPVLTPAISFMSTDEDGDAINYRIMYSTDPLFSSADSFTTSTYASGVTAEVVYPSNLIDNTTYYYKVKAQDPSGSGYWSSYSEVRSFSVFTLLGAGNYSWYQAKNAQFTKDNLSGTILVGDTLKLNATNGFDTDTLLFSNFETGTTGWTVVDAGGTGTWARVATGQADISTYYPTTPGSYYYYYSDDDAGSGDTTAEEYLYSPVIAVIDADSLILKYGYGFKYYSALEFLRVSYRVFKTGSWQSWTQLAQYSGTSANGEASFNISSQLPCDSVQMLFLYDDGANWNWAVAIDNVCFYTLTVIENNTGSLTTTPVSYAEMSAVASRSNWGYVNWRQSADGDSILVQIEYNDGGVWNLIPDGDLPGNSAGLFGDSILNSFSLQSLNTSVYDSLRAKVSLYRKAFKSTTEPMLLELEVGRNNITSIQESNVIAVMTKAGVLIKWTAPDEVYASYMIDKKIDGGSYVNVAVTKVSGSYTDIKFKENSKYTYRISGIKANGKNTILGSTTVFTSVAPKSFNLNNPNPSITNKYFTVSYDVPYKSFVSINIVDISGRVCISIADEVLESGVYRKTIDTDILADGTYFIIMKGGDYSSVKKIVRIK